MPFPEPFGYYLDPLDGREGRSEKHVSDVCSMLNVTPVDHDFIAAQNKRLGLQEQWDEVWQAFLETGGKLPA